MDSYLKYKERYLEKAQDLGSTKESAEEYLAQAENLGVVGQKY
jgi:hypothetical protein